MSTLGVSGAAGGTCRAVLAATVPPLLLALMVALALRLGGMAVDSVASFAAKPQAQPTVTVEYETLRQAERALGFQLLLPTHLPAELRWPPATIRGEVGPPATISFLLLSEDRSRSLVITEMWQPEGSWPAKLVTGTPVVVAGALGQVESGLTASGPASRLTWALGERAYELRGSYSPEELLRIAGSIPRPDSHR
mgnify:CR=1 FL=1